MFGLDWRIIPKKLTFNPIESDMKNWLASEQRDIVQKYSNQSLLERYAPLLGISMIVILTIVVTWIIWGKADVIANSLASASDKLADAMRYAGTQTLR